MSIEFIHRKNNMSVEEFFKPNLKKIILAVILFAIISIQPIVPAVYVYKCPGCIYVEYHNFWMTFLGHSHKVLVTYIIFISEILISYIIACFIFFVASHSKKSN